MKGRSIVELIAAAGIVAATGVVGWRLRHRATAHFRSLFRGAEAVARFSDILETFFNEAAVLWFVFPVLDAIFREGKGQPLSAVEVIETALITWGVALLFFYFAVFFKRLAKQGEGKDH